MRKSITFLLPVVLLFLGNISFSQTTDSPYQIGKWQGFKAGAVCFTFDDNCPNQLAVAMPMFDQHGFKMTFFTVINWGPNWSQLKTAAANGHEIASHTLSHSSLGGLSDAQQTTELKNSQDDINAQINGNQCMTIAYPNCVTGNKSICGQYYIAARGCSGQIETSTPADFMNISSFVCGQLGSVQTSQDFNDKADAAAASNGLVVFLIHAIDNDPGYSPTTSDNIRGALDYLQTNNNKFWVSTFSNIARYIKERNDASILEVSVSDTSIALFLAGTLPDSIYNYPITIRRQLPNGWSSFSVMQNNIIINSRLVDTNSVKYVEFDAVPDNGEIVISRDKVTGIEKNNLSDLKMFNLKQNYPNPFNPSTVISYKLPQASFVTLNIYNLLGQKVTTLVNKNQNAGTYEVNFDAYKLANGIYFYSIESGKYVQVKKMMLLK